MKFQLFKIISKIFLFAILSTNISCKQKCNYITDYHPYIVQATIAFEQGEFEKSYNLLDNAFSICAPRNTRTVNEIDMMAKLSAKLGKDERALEMIELQILDGHKISKFENDTIFDKLLSSKRGKIFISKYNILRNRYLSSIDTTIYNNLTVMMRTDQMYRGDEKQNEIDQTNTEHLIRIFEDYGFPGEKYIRYRKSNFFNIGTLLLHTDDSIRLNYFLPKLKQFIINGESDPIFYANLVDQYRRYNDLPQLYGTYKKDRITRELSTHIDMETMNKNRKLIGLPTLQDEAIIHQLKIVNYPETYGRFYTK